MWAETIKHETAAPYLAQSSGKFWAQPSAGYPPSSLHMPAMGWGLHQQAGTMTGAPRYSQHCEVAALLEDSPVHRLDPVPFQLPAERQLWLPSPHLPSIPTMLGCCPA